MEPLTTTTGFKKLVESGTTRSIHNRIGANRVDTVTRSETESVSGKTRWTRPSSRDNSVNSVQKGENTENNLNKQPKKQRNLKNKQ